MNPHLVILVIAIYIGALYLVSWYTSRDADSDAFYLAGRKAPWYLVSYGMIGVAISGITFISVPGEVGNSQFTYFQLVIGYALGLILVALILIPLFYRNRVVSIYSYLEGRFGVRTHKTGAAFFLFAHMLGAAFRLYLMAYVLQLIVFDELGVPFACTVFVTLMLIWLYTYRGGIKTVIYTDVLQTTFLLLAAVVGIIAVANSLNVSLVDLGSVVWKDGLDNMFDWSWSSTDNFFKLMLTGLLLTFTNNGLDQAIMQKHLACASVGDAQKNILTLSVILLLVNLLFLFLGGSLVYYAAESQIAMPEESDQLYPLLATQHLGWFAGITFIIGLAAAAYSSADTSLTGLTTAFCVDFLGYQQHRDDNPGVRKWVHLGFSLLLFVFIIVFRALNDQSVISAFIKISGYAYGPLLGLFAFGVISDRRVKDRWIPALCILVPVLSYILEIRSFAWFGYQFNYETIIVNAVVTMLGLYLISLGERDN